MDNCFDMAIKAAREWKQDHDGFINEIKLFHGWPIVHTDYVMKVEIARGGTVFVYVGYFPNKGTSGELARVELSEKVDKRYRIFIGGIHKKADTYEILSASKARECVAQHLGLFINPDCTKEEAALRAAVWEDTPNSLVVLNDYLKEHGKKDYSEWRL